MTTRKILIAYDNSFHSAKAVQWAVNKGFLDRAKDEITIATFLNEDPSQLYDTLTLEAAAMYGGEWLVDEYKFKVDQLEKNAEEVIKHVSEVLKEFKVKSAIIKGRSTAVGEGIVDYANNNGTDLIVIGSRGLGYFKRQLSGSVSDYVVHHATIPVLVAKTAEEPPKPIAK